MNDKCPLCGDEMHHDKFYEECWGLPVLVGSFVECNCGYSYEYRYGETIQCFDGHILGDIVDHWADVAAAVWYESKHKLKPWGAP